MRQCEFTSRRLGDGKWEHVCSACGGRFIVAAESYQRGCRAALAERKKDLVAITAKPACQHLGEFVRSEKCQFCKKRDKFTEVRLCAIWGQCSLLPYRAGQPEQSCKGCQQYEPMNQPAPAEAPPTIASITPPPGLTPLPAGRVFNGTEWRNLRPDEKEYYRALRRAREASNPPPPAPIDPGATPFSDPAGRPIHLSHLGQGASAFLVLGGPSLLTHDLSELRRRGIFTLAVNNSATVLRPNGWVFVDTPGKFHDSIWRDPGVMKFVRRTLMHRQLRTRDASGKFMDLRGSDGKALFPKDMPGIVGIAHNADFDPARWLQEPSINWGNSRKSAKRNGRHNVLNSMFAAIKVLYALGFRAIYLLGCDFVMTPDQPYAFAQGKSPGAASSNNGTYVKLREMLAELRPHFAAAGLHIFNCNPTSALTVFPHVDFSTAIATAIGGMESAESLRADGWYEGYAGN